MSVPLYSTAALYFPYNRSHLIVMNPKMLLSLSQPREPLPTDRTAVDLFSSVDPFVALHVTFLVERLAAVPAVIRSLACVSAQVYFKYVCIAVALSAQLTAVWPLFLVHHHVRL